MSDQFETSASPAKAIPNSRQGNDEVEQRFDLMSPSNVTHPCAENLFPLDEEEENKNEDQSEVYAQECINSKSELTVDPKDVENLESNVDFGASGNEQSESVDDDFHDAVEELSPMRRLSIGEIEETAESVSPHKGRSNVDLEKPSLKCGSKLIFILSEAGKPIFSPVGCEESMISVAGVMQTLVSYVDNMKDSLRSINFEGGKIVFLKKSPIILVAVTKFVESETQLIVQLTYMYNQLLSLLTLTQITHIFERRQGFDLRRMIAGSERILESLSKAMDEDPCFMLSAVKVLPMPSQQRDPISNVITQACTKTKGILFAILIAENQLITLVRNKKYFLHPADLHLIFNLVNCTESFKVSETWTPICLPKFDATGFMQAHVSYLAENHPACLILLTVERDIFEQISNARRKIVESLEKQSSLGAIKECLKNRETMFSSVSPEIQHFLYKAKTAAQFTSPDFTNLYDQDEARKRLQGTYLQMQNKLHSMHRPAKLIFFGGQYENVVAWITQTFELYTSLKPTTSKSYAIDTINKLLRFCKKEEQTLFILNAPTF